MNEVGERLVWCAVVVALQLTPQPGGGGGNRECFRRNSSNKFDFVHFSDVSARLGSRELRAVKIPASYDAWRPPKRRKNDSEKIRFLSAKMDHRHLRTIVQGLCSMCSIDSIFKKRKNFETPFLNELSRSSQNSYKSESNSKKFLDDRLNSPKSGKNEKG